MARGGKLNLSQLLFPDARERNAPRDTFLTVPPRSVYAPSIDLTKRPITRRPATHVAQRVLCLSSDCVAYATFDDALKLK